jgi:ABC-type glutathione transport system ATPase component
VTVLNFGICELLICHASTPEQVVLKNFNLRLPAGKTVAIVGSSGNGKSTVAALLERYCYCIFQIIYCPVGCESGRNLLVLWRKVVPPFSS